MSFYVRKRFPKSLIWNQLTAALYLSKQLYWARTNVPVQSAVRAMPSLLPAARTPFLSTKAEGRQQKCYFHDTRLIGFMVRGRRRRRRQDHGHLVRRMEDRQNLEEDRHRRSFHLHRRRSARGGAQENAAGRRRRQSEGRARQERKHSRFSRICLPTFARSI